MANREKYDETVMMHRFLWSCFPMPLGLFLYGEVYCHDAQVSMVLFSNALGPLSVW